MKERIDICMLKMEKIRKNFELWLIFCIFFQPFFGRNGQSQMQRKPKSIKTRKAVAKRFKITGSGKIVRNRPGKRHLLASKNAKRRRKLGTATLVDKTDHARVLENLPFSH